jgi:murein DD-endopeptidase MepM/ murein hydrolase activator NlpD
MTTRHTLAASLLLLLSALPLAASSLPHHSAVPGGVALIPLGSSTSAPIARLNGQRVLVTRQGEDWLAVVGLPLNLAAGAIHLEVERHPQITRQQIAINVSDKSYETQHITVTNQRHVEPLQQDLTRIREEQAASRAAFRHWRDKAPAGLMMALPVEGRISGHFGRRRVFNGKPRQPHSGLDIAAPRGTPIIAPAAGIVSEIGDYFFNGKTIFIDHGHGLITMICHLDSIGVRKGQQIAVGETIATVGSTGRVTGPHLHWSISLNDSRVDPLLFLSTADLNRLGVSR